MSAISALPDLAALPGVSDVSESELRVLDAVYLDTAGFSLARRAVALRCRTGGPDEGWHVKSGAPEGRREWGWPLGDHPVGHSGAEHPGARAVLDHPAVPSDVRAAVAQWCGDDDLHPIARVRNDRHAILLRDASGAVVAEFLDDHVTATELGAGSTTSWREWEVELGPAAPADVRGREKFFAAVDAAVASVGGVPAASGSKLQRALGR